MAIIAELVNGYVAKVISIFDQLTEGIPEEERQRAKDLHNVVVEKWNECFQGKAPIDQFNKALDAWGAGQVELIGIARPKIKPKRKREVGITEKQQRFIDAYPECLNASEAARRAGYSKRSAAEVAYENMKNPKIRAAIDEKLKQPHTIKYYKTL